jgi:hypothetical protein
LSDSDDDLGSLRKREVYLGHRENPMAWTGEERWRNEFHRYESLLEIVVLNGHRFVHTANCTPARVDPSKVQRALWVRFDLAPGRHRIPADIARACAHVDRDTGYVVRGIAPLSARLPEHVDAPVHPSLLPFEDARSRNPRGRFRR